MCGSKLKKSGRVISLSVTSVTPVALAQAARSPTISRHDTISSRFSFRLSSRLFTQLLISGASNAVIVAAVAELTSAMIAIVTPGFSVIHSETPVIANDERQSCNVDTLHQIAILGVALLFAPQQRLLPEALERQGRKPRRY